MISYPITFTIQELNDAKDPKKSRSPHLAFAALARRKLMETLASEDAMARLVEMMALSMIALMEGDEPRPVWAVKAEIQVTMPVKGGVGACTWKAESKI